MLEQRVNMLGKWHRTYPADFWRGNKSCDFPKDGAKVAIYFRHTGYDICDHVVSIEDLGGEKWESNCFTSSSGFLCDEDLLWSEDLSLAINREPIPAEYLEDYQQALDNPTFPYLIGPSGKPEAIELREYIELGQVPYDESAVQVGDPYSEAAATVQCKAFAKQLQRLHPKATFGIKWFSHEFGRYPEVVVYYDPDIEAEQDLAFEIEGDLPAEWDEESRQSIKATATLDPGEKPSAAEAVRLEDGDRACDEGVD
jgi:hypothetical protein